MNIMFINKYDTNGKPLEGVFADINGDGKLPQMINIYW